MSFDHFEAKRNGATITTTTTTTNFHYRISLCKSWNRALVQRTLFLLNLLRMLKISYGFLPLSPFLFLLLSICLCMNDTRRYPDHLMPHMKSVCRDGKNAHRTWLINVTLRRNKQNCNC